MHRATTWSAVLGVLSFGAPAAAQLPRPGCDPITYETPEPVPAGEELVCGDGRLDAFTAACSRSCAGGCEGVSGCGPVECIRGIEVCDGAELGGASCRSLGFSGGTLACDAGCAGYDTSGCSICRTARCREVPLTAPIETLHIVPGRRGALLLWQVGTSLHVAVVAEDLSLSTVSEITAVDRFDVAALDDGWLLARAADRRGVIEHVTADGTRTEIERLASEVSEMALWALDGGGVLLTTGGAPGAPVRVVGADGDAMRPSLPGHASRSDGGRMLLLDADCAGVLAAPGAGGMRAEWAPAAGDYLLAFTRPSFSGVQVVREGARVTGMAWVWGDGVVHPLEVGCGAAPSATSDVLGDVVVPATSATLRMELTRGRYRDALEPGVGPPVVRTGRATTESSVTPRRPLFVEHGSVRVLGHARIGRDVLGAALVDRRGSLTLALSRGR